MHPSLNRLKRSGLILGLALAGCNVFNPSGEGDAGPGKDAQLTAAENLFRQQDYQAATASFQAAIQADSANSMAYYGYSKSVMRYWDVNASTLLDEVSKAQDKSGIPFVGASDWDVTRYLQATSRVRLALGAMTDRDSLTRWWQYSQHPEGSAAKSDPLAAKRIAFMQDYWSKADQGAKGYHAKSEFPLSDLTMPSQKIVADFGFVELIYAVTHLRDLNGDNTIDSHDNVMKLLTFNSTDGFKVDNLNAIVDSLDTPEKKEQFNNLIQNVASGLSSASTVLGLLTPALTGQIAGAGGDTTGGSQSLSGDVTQKADSVITSLGDAITFYQFGDGKDNDGDGCVDEEIADGKDNDGDGFVDEDARWVPVDTVDNDHNGKGKNPILDKDVGEDLDAQFHLKFTLDAGFTTGLLYKDKAARIAAQKDSLQVRYDAAGSAAAMSAYNQAQLAAAKKNIGGCWNNYK
jgi:hypothetical protein